MPIQPVMQLQPAAAERPVIIQPHILMPQQAITPLLPFYKKSEKLTQPMRILMVLDQFNIGGTETHVHTITREMIRKDIYIAVVGKKGALINNFVALGCAVYQVDFVDDQYYPNDDLVNEMVEQVKTIIIEENISLVHAHQIPSGKFASIAAQQTGTPFVFTAHGRYYENDLKQMLHTNTPVICVSPVVYEEMKDKLTQRTILIPNGIDPNEYDYRPALIPNLRKELGIGDKAPLILYAGRISWEKASICMDVIRACQLLQEQDYPDLHVLIAGTGNKNEEIASMIDAIHKESNKEFIHFNGVSLHMCAYYSAADCLIGTGRTAIEAMASKCSVIAIGVRGYLGLVHPENYEDAWKSWFGDHGSEQDCTSELLIRDIRKSLSMTEQERRIKGWAGRKYILDHFHINEIIHRHINFYQQVLKENRLVELQD